MTGAVRRQGVDRRSEAGAAAADSEETVDGAESLARVRGDLEYDGRLTGAAAYLGLREKGDKPS